MQRIILTTLFSVLFACFVLGILLFLDAESSDFGIYIIIMVFGNIIFPTLLGVLLFQIVRRKIKFSNHGKTLVCRIGALILIFALGLILWAVVDVVKYHGDFSGLTIQNIVKDFNSQFLGFTPIALCLAVAIPSFDMLIGKK